MPFFNPLVTLPDPNDVLASIAQARGVSVLPPIEVDPLRNVFAQANLPRPAMRTGVAENESNGPLAGLLGGPNLASLSDLLGGVFGSGSVTAAPSGASPEDPGNRFPLPSFPTSAEPVVSQPLPLIGPEGPVSTEAPVPPALSVPSIFASSNRAEPIPPVQGVAGVKLEAPPEPPSLASPRPSTASLVKLGLIGLAGGLQRNPLGAISLGLQESQREETRARQALSDQGGVVALGIISEANEEAKGNPVLFAASLARRIEQFRSDPNQNPFAGAALISNLKEARDRAFKVGEVQRAGQALLTGNREDALSALGDMLRTGLLSSVPAEVSTVIERLPPKFETVKLSGGFTAQLDRSTNRLYLPAVVGQNGELLPQVATEPLSRDSRLVATQLDAQGRPVSTVVLPASPNLSESEKAALSRFYRVSPEQLQDDLSSGNPVISGQAQALLINVRAILDQRGELTLPVREELEAKRQQGEFGIQTPPISGAIGAVQEREVARRSAEAVALQQLELKKPAVELGKEDKLYDIRANEFISAGGKTKGDVQQLLAGSSGNIRVVGAADQKGIHGVQRILQLADLMDRIANEIPSGGISARFKNLLETRTQELLGSPGPQYISDLFRTTLKLPTAVAFQGNVASNLSDKDVTSTAEVVNISGFRNREDVKARAAFLRSFGRLSLAGLFTDSEGARRAITDLVEGARNRFGDQPVYTLPSGKRFK